MCLASAVALTGCLPSNVTQAEVDADSEHAKATALTNLNDVLSAASLATPGPIEVAPSGCSSVDYSWNTWDTWRMSVETPVAPGTEQSILDAIDDAFTSRGDWAVFGDDADEVLPGDGTHRFLTPRRGDPETKVTVGVDTFAHVLSVESTSGCFVTGPVSER